MDVAIGVFALPILTSGLSSYILLFGLWLNELKRSFQRLNVLIPKNAYVNEAKVWLVVFMSLGLHQGG